MKKSIWLIGIMMCLASCTKDDGGSALNLLNPLHFTPSPSYYSGITQRDVDGNLVGTPDPTQWNGTGSLASVRVYPNPWQSSRETGNAITFDQLPANFTIVIYENPFTVVNRLTPSSPSVRRSKVISIPGGSLTWNLTDSDGNALPSAIYHAVITSGNDQTSGNIQIER